MLAKLQALMDSYVKSSEVVMLFSLISGNGFSDFFQEKWKVLKNKKNFQIQAINLKSLLRDSKSNNKKKCIRNALMKFLNRKNLWF